MKLSALILSLPHGFHDAKLYDIRMDFQHDRAVMTMRLWVGDQASDDYDDRERCRPGELSLSGIGYWVVEPQRCIPWSGGPLSIDMGDLASLHGPPDCALPETAAGSSAHWMFVSQWDSMVYFTVRDAEFRWLSD